MVSKSFPNTVDPLISEHIGTGGCSDMQNVRICKIMNIIIIIMNIIIDNNVNVFIYCITYLLNRYMEIVWTVQELRLKLGSQVKIYMCIVTVPEMKKKI